MEDFLKTEGACFYHITTWSCWEKIEKTGLKPFNGKGISVIRLDDERIINSIIALQLNAPEIRKENDFVLLRLTQYRNKFELFEIEPDVVDEWTWPIHNNIVKNKIHQNYIELVRRFSIEDWDAINIEDFKNEKEFKQSDFYKNSFNLDYVNKEGEIYQIDTEGNKIEI